MNRLNLLVCLLAAAPPAAAQPADGGIFPRVIRQNGGLTIMLPKGPVYVEPEDIRFQAHDGWGGDNALIILLQGEEVARLGRGRDYIYQLSRRVYGGICSSGGCAAAYSAAEVRHLAQLLNRMAREARAKGVQLSLNLHRWNDRDPDPEMLLTFTGRESRAARQRRIQEMLLEQSRRLQDGGLRSPGI